MCWPGALHHASPELTRHLTAHRFTMFQVRDAMACDFIVTSHGSRALRAGGALQHLAEEQPVLHTRGHTPAPGQGTSSAADGAGGGQDGGLSVCKTKLSGGYAETLLTSAELAAMRGPQLVSRDWVARCLAVRAAPCASRVAATEPRGSHVSVPLRTAGRNRRPECLCHPPPIPVGAPTAEYGACACGHGTRVCTICRGCTCSRFAPLARRHEQDKMVMSVSGYAGQARKYIRRCAELLGFTFSNRLKKVTRYAVSLPASCPCCPVCSVPRDACWCRAPPVAELTTRHHASCTTGTTRAAASYVSSRKAPSLSTLSKRSCLW